MRKTTGPLLLTLLVSCNSEMPAGRDAASDVTPEVSAEAPRVACARTTDCPPRHFCGPASHTCVSAVVEVVAGANHSCARHEDGAVTCWGLAESLRGGGAAVLPPREVAEGRGALALAAGLHQTCALTPARRVHCWGNQTLDVTREDGAPLGEVAAVTLGNGFGCAANQAGTWCWGRNDFGQLARPLTVKQSAAAVLAHPGPQRFLGAGIAVLTHDGTGRLCAWGRNATKLISAVDAVDVFTTPECRDQADVADLIVGETHACARHADGRFSCWGERYYGQLGLPGNDTADVPPPGTAVSPPVSALVAGVSHTCARYPDGTVACFGRNDRGQIGPLATGVEEEIRAPTKVTLPPVTVLGAGSTAQHTCAVLEDGSLLCWGNDHAGQLGDNPGAVNAARFSRQPVLVQF